METQKIQTEIYIIYAVADEFYMEFYEETAKPDDYVFGVYTDEQLANDTLAEISQNLKDFEETGKLNLKKTSYAEKKMYTILIYSFQIRVNDICNILIFFNIIGLFVMLF